MSERMIKEAFAVAVNGFRPVVCPDAERVEITSSHGDKYLCKFTDPAGMCYVGIVRIEESVSKPTSVHVTITKCWGHHRHTPMLDVTTWYDQMRASALTSK